MRFSAYGLAHAMLSNLLGVTERAGCDKEEAARIPV